MKTTLDYLLNLVLNFNIRETYYATVLQNIYTGTVKVYTINIKTKQHLLVKNHFKTIQLFWRYALKFSHKDALKSDNELAFMHIKISVFFSILELIGSFLYIIWQRYFFMTSICKSNLLNTGLRDFNTSIYKISTRIENIHRGGGGGATTLHRVVTFPLQKKGLKIIALFPT